jgi:hypothetical protein
MRKCFDLSDPGRARTVDPLIKSQLLYQLSYGVIRNFWRTGAKVR